MTPKTFFRMSLLLPVVAPAVAFLIGPINIVLALLMFSLGFGGVPYIPFAAAAFVTIGRLRTAWGVQKLSFIAPLVFFPFQAMFVLAVYAWETMPNFRLRDYLISLLPFAFYVAIVGYSYVAIVNLAYLALARLGRIRVDSGEQPIG
jgi:hypothetical protein